ncbi:hypothetical protein KKF59_01680 [Patescibacteria group bacterium]|nr:hypothetical protein [Patescibacteria group bacterium]MBU1034458.1 hypothetical protein [Patescibacteria group bacterium]MBU1629908.1 hypothetical protein [Patescibacteria group bacterium]MBU1907824.1 hypothetical protein [Patescibacteria group bacterium]
MAKMKRALFIVFGVFCALVMGFFWWLFRDTPEKALRDGVRNLMEVQNFEKVDLEASWSDLAKGVTKGFDFSGQADVRDLAHPNALGTLRLGAGLLDGEQIVDLVLTQEQAALRPRAVSKTWQDQYAQLSNDEHGEKFLAFQRDAFLEKNGFGHFVAQGSSEEIRSVLPALIQTVQINQKWKKYATPDGRHLADVDFTLDNASFKPFLNALTRLWHDADLTPADLHWIERASAGVARGVFKISVDLKTRQPVVLSGAWPLLDDEKKEIAQLKISLAFQGLNQGGPIISPENSTDVSQEILGIKSPETDFQLAPAKQRPPDLEIPSATSSDAEGEF